MGRTALAPAIDRARTWALVGTMALSLAGGDTRDSEPSTWGCRRVGTYVPWIGEVPPGAPLDTRGWTCTYLM
jgi:hypothetical protein